MRMNRATMLKPGMHLRVHAWRPMAEEVEQWGPNKERRGRHEEAECVECELLHKRSVIRWCCAGHVSRECIEKPVEESG